MSITGERIRQRRTELKLTQLDLAYALHTHPTQISRYERGDNDPSGTVLFALAKALYTSSDYLVGLVDDATPRFEPDELAHK